LSRNGFSTRNASRFIESLPYLCAGWAFDIMARRADRIFRRASPKKSAKIRPARPDFRGLPPHGNRQASPAAFPFPVRIAGIRAEQPHVAADRLDFLDGEPEQHG